MKRRSLLRQSLRIAIPVPLAALITVGCASPGPLHLAASTDNRIAVYQAVVKLVLEGAHAELPAITPALLSAKYCGCDNAAVTGPYLAAKLPALDPVTFSAYCAAESSQALTSRELRALGKPGPLQSGLGRSTATLRFSPVGFGSGGDQALVCVVQLYRGDFWLLQKRDDKWSVVGIVPSWIS